MEEKNFALLIDADNTSSKYIKTIVDEITNMGITTYRRIYGDWNSGNLSAWKETLLEHSIVPVQQFAYTTGKNSTDSAMIIDAMGILYTGNVDGFCLVSSDSDFTRLAQRLREGGKMVVGMGRKHTPNPFVKACNQFKYLDVIGDAEKAEKTEKAAKAATAKTAAAKKSTEEKKRREQMKDFAEKVRKIAVENSEDDGWIFAGRVGSLLQTKYSDFDSRNYGYSKLSPLLEELSAYGFKTEKRFLNDKNPNSYDLYIKVKD